MLSVEEARAAVLALVDRPLGTEPVPLAGALGRTLRDDVRAAGDVPAFANAAMDGVALRSGPSGRRLRIVGESRAGSPSPTPVGADDEAVRISTGAAMPDGADAVLQLERLEDAADGRSTRTREEVRPGRNVRAAGSDLRAGATALRAGTALGPAELGLAAAAGHATLRCALRPAVAVVTTGDELVAPGAALRHGQVHDSNAPMLAALLRGDGARVLPPAHAPDDPTATRAALASAIARADVVLVCGGVSVGPHDHVKPALEALGVVERFWRVALKPGKPTWCGRAPDGTLVLGLPGNPVSALVTAVLFARPALRALQGADPLPRTAHGRLAAPAPRDPSRDSMIRVTLDAAGRATPTGDQGSHRLSSLVGADALALVPAGEGDLPAGAEVLLERL